MKLKAITFQADFITPTGRLYPKDVLEKAVEEYKKTVDEGKGLIQLCASGGNTDFRMSVGVIKDIFIDDEGFIVFDAEPLQRKEVMFGAIKALDIVGIGEVNDSGEITSYEILYPYQVDTAEDLQKIEDDSMAVFAQLADKMKEEQEDDEETKS